ncbi:DUF5808 domain-containing protein [Clostridium sp. Marseille-P2415]|uniref:DUF5808 domain-containing protein n=1 Tax=Clostridium sp. Marseille-P2415 TaxID=1805471 RepID=UPI0013566494|nr:DUF5808 domain-containing protein [Clostridium sp. Marseille-P2415]
MLFHIILFVCLYPVLPIIYYVMKLAVREKKNIVLGITLPTEYLNAPEVAALCKAYEKELKKYMLIFGVFPFLFLFISYVSISLTLWIGWIMMSILALSLLYIKYNKKIGLLKAEMQWNTVNKEKVFIDTRTATEKIRAIKRLPFLPPIVFSLIPLAAEFLFFSGTKHFLTNELTLFSISFLSPLSLFLGILTDNQRSEIISMNSDLNSNFNRAKKHIWGKCFLWIAWINAIFTFITWAVIKGTLKNTILFLVLTMAYSILLTVILFRGGTNIRKLREKAADQISSESERILNDDDSHWIYGMFYYNPNDSHTMVDKRFGMGMTMNMATKAGKAVTAFTFAFLLYLPVLCIYMIFDEFTPVNLEIRGNQVIAEHLKEEYAVNISDIQETKLITELPDTSRIFGTGMDILEKGTFSVEGYGDCEICLNPQTSAFLVIKTLEDTYIFSDEDPLDTKEIYKQLTK